MSISSSDAGRLASKIALVTGAARGIGAAIAERLAGDGCCVAVNYLSHADAAEQVAGRIRVAGGDAFAIQGDVGRPETAPLLIDAVLARYGKLDILVNNAGAFSGGPVDEIVNADFDRLFAANVKSVLFMSQAAARALQHGGVIVNLSALNTRAPSARGALYSATKAAVESLTASLAREWGSRGIRVNAVAPGQTESDMLRLANSPESLRASPSRIALGRLGLPDDIAKVVAFLASSKFELDHGRNASREWGPKIVAVAYMTAGVGLVARRR